MPLKLDLGAGKVSPPGFVPVGHAHGTEIFPLAYDDGLADEIRAVHCLEHFPHRQNGAVIAEWTRVLKKGGRLRIAVPDFRKIAEGYIAGTNAPHEGYVVGGQIDDDDFHKSVFDHDKLHKTLTAAGLALIRPWESEIDDCAALPISLNLEAYKPYVDAFRVSGAMSVPRLGFMDNFFCAMDAASLCKVKLSRHGGAYWGQSLTKAFEHILQDDNPDAILTLDYDSIFKPYQLAHMMQIMMVWPEIDALAALQSSRHFTAPLFTIREDDGRGLKVTISRDAMRDETTPISTAHFGLTLIRSNKLRSLPKPWFHSVPSAAGDWNDGHVDEDIEFWNKWVRAGNTLHLANRIAIGHAELMVRWPDENLGVLYQSTSDFVAHGIPDKVWK